MTQFSCKIKNIHSDNGNEFLMTSYYASLGIVYQRSCVETPLQNSIVERKHMHLECYLVSPFYAHLSKCFWSFSLCHATYLINRICTLTLDLHTPYELLFKEPHNLTNLKCFGCLTYPFTLLRNIDKLDPCATRCIFLGYPTTTKGYLIRDLHTITTFISGNRTFYEKQFPYLSPTNPPRPSPIHVPLEDDSPFIFEFSLHNITPPNSNP